MKAATWQVLTALAWLAVGNAIAQSRPATTSGSAPEASELVAELRGMSDPTAAELARAADLVAHRDRRVRALALEILLRHAAKAAAAIPILQRHLADADPAIHACVSAGLSAVASAAPRSPRAIARILTTGDASERYRALGQLEALGARAKPALGSVAALVAGPDLSLAHQALRTLAAIGGDAPETPLLLLAMARDSKVHATLRGMVLQRLTQIAPDVAVTALETLAKDGDDHFWATAAATVRDLMQVRPEARAQLMRFVRAAPRARRHQLTNTVPDEAFAPEDLIAFLVEDLESDQDRVQALHRLSRLGATAHPALPKVAALLGHPQPTVRAQVLEVLATFGPVARDHAEAIEHLALDPNPEVALGALAALIACCDQGQRERACIEGAMRHLSARVRASAAAIAAAYAGPTDDLVLAVVDRLRDSESIVRDAATRSLLIVDSEWVRSKALAETHASPQVRTALTALCERRAIEGPIRPLASEDPRAKLAFLKTLRVGFAPGVLELRALGSMLREGPHVAAIVMDALALCGEKALPLLGDLAALDVGPIPDGASRRRTAVLAMGESGRRELLEWFGHPTQELQALTLIGELGVEGSFARERIFELVLTRSPLTGAALRTLERIGVAEAQLAGLRTLHSERERIDAEVAGAVAAARDTPDRLVKLATSSDAYARATAFAAFGRTGQDLHPQLARVAAKALGDDHAGVRAAAITALRTLLPTAAETALREVRCAGTRDVRVRAAILARWWSPSEPAPITLLRQGMADETVAIQEIALQIVARQGSPAALGLVLEFARNATRTGLASAVGCLTTVMIDPDQRLRRAARDGLRALLAERGRELATELAADAARKLAQPDLTPSASIESAIALPTPEAPPHTVEELLAGLRDRPALMLQMLEGAAVSEQARLIQDLGKQCRRATAPELQSLLSALAQLGELARFAIEDLIALVKESDPADLHFRQVTEIMTRIGPTGIDALQTLALSGSDVETSIVEALERSDSRTPSPAIMAAIALHLTGPRVLSAAQRLFANGSGDTRLHGAALLLAAAEDDPDAGPAVTKLLGIDSVFHRRRAAELLAKWPASAASAIPELLELLLEDRVELRAAGLRALAAAGTAAAVARTALEEATRDPAPEIAEAARRLLR